MAGLKRVYVISDRFYFQFVFLDQVVVLCLLSPAGGISTAPPMVEFCVPKPSRITHLAA